MNEKEKAALYVISEDPALLEKVTVKASIFKGKSRQIFDEIQRQFQRAQSFSYEEAADKLKMKVSEFHTLFEGCYRFDVSKLEFILKKIEKESLSKKVAATLKKEMDIELKTGTVDDSAMAEIRGMFNKLDALNEVEQFSIDYNSVDSRSITWLWPGRIPLGMITLVAGHPGVGKSFFAAWLAAKLSRGESLPAFDETNQMKPCSTLIISAEDDPGQIIKPRLEGNAADLARIISFADPLKFSLDAIGILERELEKNANIRMVVIDPLNAFLGKSMDYFRDPDVRMKLMPLKELALERMVAVLGIVHFNKKEDSELITRIGGSMAFAGVARSVLGISFDNRETEEDNRDTRLLSSLKMNLSRKPDGLAFKINDTLRIDFDPKPVMMDAEVLFSRDARERKQRQSFAETWLLGYLEEHPECLSTEVRKAAEEEGIPERTIYRTKARLLSQGILESQETGYGKERKSYWRLAPRGKETKSS